MVPAKREREDKEEDNASLNVSVLTLSNFAIYFLFRRTTVVRRRWSALSRP